MEKILCFLREYAAILNALSVLLALGALVAAVYIPRRIMLNQIYADLIHEYYTPEMGGATLAIFDFYANDCGRNPANIPAKYKEKYEEQIKIPLEQGIPVCYADTLHFQRRILSQFYFNMAKLRYDHYYPRLSTKDMKQWFTLKDVKLLAILLHMVEAASAVFIDAGQVPEPPEPPEDDAPMNQLLGKLYEETEGLS